MTRSDITPIGDYGIIGDTRTAALVSPRGAIDWMCLPRFDGAPVFGSLVAGPDAGTFRISPAGPFDTVDRSYGPGPTVLATTWSTGDSEVVLRDAMVADVRGDLLPSTVLVRSVEVRGGSVDVEVVIRPMRNASEPPERSARAGMDLFVWRDLTLSVCATHELSLGADGSAVVTVDPGRPLTVVVGAADRHPAVFVPPDHALELVESDQRWWSELVSSIDYDGPWRDAVVRSVVTLELLTFSPSGAPVAAATTSLPEELGAEKNWDYRFSWFRDAALGVGTFVGLGLDADARRFFYWLLHATRTTRPRIPPALTMFGNQLPDEEIVDWAGYADSRPVRLGNVVRHQRQLDVYGFVLDAGSILTDRGHDIFADTWRALRGAADHVAETWRQPGANIWEERGEPRHWTTSKLLAWLALDRAQNIGGQRGEKQSRLDRWERAKTEIHADVVEHGYDDERNTFVRAYDDRGLDGSLLLLPLIGIEPIGSPRVRGTVDAVRRELHAGGPFFRRHGDAGEGAFLAVSFWMAQALAMTGRIDEAAELIDELVERSGPLGLLAEEFDPVNGRFLGNHPQALSHSALLQAVLAVREARDSSG